MMTGGTTRRIALRTTAFAGGALLAFAAPGLADWSPTRWGMTPEQVLATVPGAVAVERKDDGKDVAGHHQLATVPTSDGDFTLQGNFYFEPAKRQLVFIQFVAPKPDCPAYQARLEARHGPGTHDDKDLERIRIIAINWVEKGTRDGLKYVGVIATANGSWLYCHLQREKPA